jgi:hypothetical protein
MSGILENSQINSTLGGVAEWLKAPVLKTGGGVSRPWVRIPPPPPASPLCPGFSLRDPLVALTRGLRALEVNGRTVLVR